MFKKKEKSEVLEMGWKRVWLEMRNNRRIFLLVSFLVVFSSIMDVSSTYLLGKVIDFIANPGGIEFWNFEFNGLILFLILLAGSIIGDYTMANFRYYYFEPLLGFKIYQKYFLEIFKKVSNYPVSFFKTIGIGKVTYTMTNSSSTIERSIPQFFGVFGLLVEISTILFFVFIISPLTCLFLSGMFIFYILTFLFTKNKISKLVEKHNKERKTVSEKLIERINLIFEVKRNNKEFVEYQKSRSNIVDEKGMFYKKNIFNLKINLWREVLYMITVFGTLFLSIYFYKSGAITIGEVTSLSVYSIFLIWNYGNIIKAFSTLVENFTIIGDAEKLLQNIPENYEEKKTRVDVKGEVEFKNVDFGYDKNTEYTKNKKVFSLQNINLKINKGQKVAFVGQSGGGKSTSVELVGGFYFPEKGDVLIDKVSTKEINLNDLRSSIAYVSQDIAIFNTTVKENISYGLNDEENLTEKEKTKKIQHAAKLANISEFIDSLPDGYDTKVGEKGLKLSGGQKQRIAIARAILRNPKILILDEPTSALDIESETKITSALKEVMKNRTTIIIAHRISTVRDAEKIFVFKEGKIVEEGNYQELISKKGEFKKMVELHKGLE